MTDASQASGRGWVAVALWLALQVLLTSLPGRAIPIGLPHPLDWAGHFCLFGGLGVLVGRAAALHRWPLRRLVWLGVLLTAWAALDEVHQHFIPGRDAEVSDWLSDTLGAALGLFVGTRLMSSRLARWLR